MDISGLTSASAGGFTGFGGTSSLPAGVQAKLMTQSQALNLLPPVSGPGLGAVPDIYTAVNQQALGALSENSAYAISNLLSRTGSGGGTGSAAQTSDTPPADAASSKDPALGSTLDQILKEDGFVPQDNPYALRKDFFADQGSLGSLLDFLG